MKIVAIIQARMGSTRLPGKVLMDLAGQTVLERVVRRVQRAALIGKVEIATTISPSDDKIADLAKQIGVLAFRGSEEDVLDRYWQASQKCDAEVVVRITSDCPVIDPELIDETIRTFLDQQADYASNSITPTYPRGLDTEVFTVAALERAWKNAVNHYEREHVTPYFYEHPELFRLASLNNKIDYSRHRWTLDTPEDLKLMRAIYDHFANHDHFSWKEILELVEREPALSALNAHVRQKQLQES
jgi:spore coat polysaccharide biosynthesis protein SpsF